MLVLAILLTIGFTGSLAVGVVFSIKNEFGRRSYSTSTKIRLCLVLVFTFGVFSLITWALFFVKIVHFA